VKLKFTEMKKNIKLGYIFQIKCESPSTAALMLLFLLAIVFSLSSTDLR